eukprot:6177758-Pleurochrysis_carterae.AAC.4
MELPMKGGRKETTASAKDKRRVSRGSFMQRLPFKFVTWRLGCLRTQQVQSVKCSHYEVTAVSFQYRFYHWIRQYEYESNIMRHTYFWDFPRNSGSNRRTAATEIGDCAYSSV